MRPSLFGAAVVILEVIVVPIAPSACTEPVLAPLPGTYVLSRVAGDTLPTILFTNSFDVTVVVLADTLRLGATGSGSEALREVVRQADTASAPDSVSYSTDFSIQRMAFRLVLAFAYPCPPNADCVPPPHRTGHLIPGGLEIDWAGAQRVPLLYSRVAPNP